TPATRATRSPAADSIAQSSSAVLPTPGSPRITSTPLRPARAASSSWLSAARSGRRSSSITGPHVEPPARITPPARFTLQAARVRRQHRPSAPGDPAATDLLVRGQRASSGRAAVRDDLRSSLPPRDTALATEDARAFRPTAGAGTPSLCRAKGPPRRVDLLFYARCPFSS